jgi:hypothetical protein
VQDLPADKLYKDYYRTLNATQLAVALDHAHPSPNSQPKSDGDTFAEVFQHGLATEQKRVGVTSPELLGGRALYLAAESTFLAAAELSDGSPDDGTDGGGRAGWRNTRRRWAATAARTVPTVHHAVSGHHNGVSAEMMAADEEWRHWGGLERLYSDATADMYRRAAAEEAKAREAYYRAEEAYRQVSARGRWLPLLSYRA